MEREKSVFERVSEQVEENGFIRVSSDRYVRVNDISGLHLDEGRRNLIVTLNGVDVSLSGENATHVLQQLLRHWDPAKPAVKNGSGLHEGDLESR